MMNVKARDGAVKRRLLKKGSSAPNELPVSHEPIHYSKRSAKDWMMLKLLLLRARPHQLQIVKRMLCFIGASVVIVWMSDPSLKLNRRMQTHSSNHPLVLGYYFSSEADVVTHVKRLAVYDYYRYPSKRQVEYPEEEFHRRIMNSKKYDRVRSEIVDDAKCILQDWQKTSFPTCNLIHENEISNFLRYDDSISKSQEQSQLIDNGYWRDVWMVHNINGDTVAMKTMRFMHEYTDRNFDRHRRDALVMERLSSSPNVVNLFSNCGSTTVTEFATHGSISDYIWPSRGNSTLTSIQRLQIALKVTEAIRDLHNIDQKEFASVAHTDISPSQFLVINVSAVKMNDFNRCRFIGKYIETNKSCPFQVGNNPGKFRSPEEYRINADLTEMIDIYSLGNIFYSLLTESWPFENLKEDEAQNRISEGKRPNLEFDVMKNSTDRVSIVMKEAIRICWAQEPTTRPSAMELVHFLQSELNNIIESP